MSEHRDESLMDRIKGMFGMGGGDDHDHADHDHAADPVEADGHPGDADHHATAPGAGISDAARASSTVDANEDPAMRRDEFAETGAASGQIAMPGGEEPVVGDEDRDAVERRP